MPVSDRGTKQRASDWNPGMAADVQQLVRAAPADAEAPAIPETHHRPQCRQDTVLVRRGRQIDGVDNDVGDNAPERGMEADRVPHRR